MKRTRFWVLPAVVVLLGLLSISYGQSLFGGISGDVPEIPVKVIPSHTRFAPGDDVMLDVITQGTVDVKLSNFGSIALDHSTIKEIVQICTISYY